MSHIDLLSEDEYHRLLNLGLILAEDMKLRTARDFDHLFPATGPFRRELYQKHLEFFSAGRDYKERLFMAANRIGKTTAGAFEVTCHLTGIYPDWWPGKVFRKAGEWWACGTTSETTLDIVQRALTGKADGSLPGMIPTHLIAETVRKAHGLPGSLASATIKYHDGTKSYLGFKTYEQGRKSFEGTSKQGIWCDEEPPQDVYTEMLYRTLTTKGIVLVTFTPLQGRSDVVNGYLEPENEEASESKIYIQAGWEDVPHIDEDEKRRIIATTPPFQLEARTKGEPSLGAGAIYPIAWSDIEMENRTIPDTWPKGYGMDVGWRRTAAPFVTQEPGTGIYIMYDEHYMGSQEPATHAQGIRARGSWLQGVIDPAARGRSQKDGTQLLQTYQGLGLNLHVASNAVEAGILACWQLLVSGRFRVMAKCQNFRNEFKKYHRNEKGVIVKESDHLLDGFRYWVMSGMEHMTVKPRTKIERETNTRPGRTWMGG